MVPSMRAKDPEDEADGFDGCRSNLHILPAIARRVEEMVAAGDEVRRRPIPHTFQDLSKH